MLNVSPKILLQLTKIKSKKNFKIMRIYFTTQLFKCRKTSLIIQVTTYILIFLYLDVPPSVSPINNNASPNVSIYNT